MNDHQRDAVWMASFIGAFGGLIGLGQLAQAHPLSAWMLYFLVHALAACMVATLFTVWLSMLTDEDDGPDDGEEEDELEEEEERPLRMVR